MADPRILALTAAVLAAAPRPVSGQFTLKGGVNLASFLGSDAGDAGSVTGLNLGGSFGLLGLGPVRLLGEVYYRQKGGSGTLAGFQAAAAAGETVEVGIDYVEIPVLARVDLRGGGGVTPYLQGGPAFGWKLQCGVRASAAGAAETDCDDLTENLQETVRDYEMGAVVGAGVDIPVLGGLGALSLDARYTHGLSRIGDGPDAFDVRNRAFTLMLGWSFGMGGMSPGAGFGGPMR